MADGARYLVAPATPTSWSRDRPSGTRFPPTVPSHRHTVAPTPGAETGTEPTDDPSRRSTLRVTDPSATVLVQRSASVSRTPSRLGENVRSPTGPAPLPTAPPLAKSKPLMPASTTV